ncbi:hypothetical protein GCM10020295_02560 [Streptomyces cinereospinus]
MTLYHEWVHFYQYHATTYGYLHRMLSNAQLLLANGFLRVAREERGRRRERLPLTVGSTALEGASTENPNAFNRRALAMIQQKRDAISGFGPFPTLSSMAEWRLLGLVLDEMFGIPRFSFPSRPCPRPPSSATNGSTTSWRPTPTSFPRPGCPWPSSGAVATPGSRGPR